MTTITITFETLNGRGLQIIAKCDMPKDTPFIEGAVVGAMQQAIERDIHAAKKSVEFVGKMLGEKYMTRMHDEKINPSTPEAPATPINVDPAHPVNEPTAQHVEAEVN